MTDTEIIERVRKIYAEIEEQAGDSADWLRQYEAVREAGDRIEELRRRLLAEENHVEILNIENGQLQAERDHAVAALSEQIATLTRERDEARREVCRDEAYRLDPLEVFQTPQQVAKRRGWDCFKDEP